MDTEKWGRSKARERYGSEGMKKMADGGATKPVSLDPQVHLDALKQAQENIAKAAGRAPTGMGQTSITINGKTATSK